MQITLLGATGKVGRLVAAEALARGYDVVAFQRRPEKVVENPRLTVYQGDIYEQEQVWAAMTGSSAVISTLGSWGTPRKDVLTTAMQHIISGAHQNGITRVVSLTGADARAPGDTLDIVHKLTHPLLNLIAGKVLRDGEQHIVLLSQSGLDWTVIRSPVMRSWGNKLTYSLGSKRPLAWSTVNRQAVATSMIDELEHRQHSASAPFISSK